MVLSTGFSLASSIMTWNYSITESIHDFSEKNEDNFINMVAIWYNTDLMAIFIVLCSREHGFREEFMSDVFTGTNDYSYP